MKNSKRIVSIILVVAILMAMASISASANYYASAPINGGIYYIQHVGSGKLLDITDESTQNGARLQIWDKYYAHQNQVFWFTKVGNYWKISPWNSKKAIEVRNSSKSDYAEVAQWDYKGLASQQWQVICNSDGSVSFCNRNSGKYLDVYLNGTTNGSKLIQYTSNKSNAQKFRLYRLYDDDILNAKWERTVNTSEITWTQQNFNSPVANYTSFKNGSKYPSPGKQYLKKVEYIDADTVHNMIVKKSLNKSTLSQIKEIVTGEAKEEAASALLSKMGYNIPCVGIAMGVLETLATSQSSSEWDKFANTTRSGKGIKKTTYSTITLQSYYGPLNNGTTKYGMNYCVKEVYSYSYSVWNGNGNVTSPSGYSGYWEYNFK